jgi:hypothetical protein
MRWFLRIAAALLLIGVAAPDAPADVLVFGFSTFDGNENLNLTFAGGGTLSISTNGNQGWWSPTIFNLPGNTNYVVGNSSGEQFNDFFSFNVAGLSPTVTGATLSLTEHTASTSTSETSENVTFGSVAIPEATLIQVQNNPSAAIYNALGSGTTYGVLNVPLGTSLNILTLTLDGSAVADINAAIVGGGTGDGFFTVGGTLSPATATTPEPATFTLIGIGVTGLLGYGWWQRRKLAAA